MASPLPTSRRVFLQTLAASAAVPCAIGCASSGGTSPAVVGDVDGGTVANLAVGTLRAISGQPVAIGRDANGVYALTLICTHDGCDIGQNGSVTATAISCSCHGSKFNANGAVINGPANAPLQHFEVAVDAAGKLTVKTGSKVDAAARTTVG